jgi:hypothetical protein
VTEFIPPDAEDAAEETGEVSIAARILMLRQAHRDLDRQIEEIHSYPYQDQLLLQRLKKKKLRMKDTIERLQGDLIPDLNA